MSDRHTPEVAGRAGSLSRTWVLYAAILAVSIGAYLLIRSVGERESSATSAVVHAAHPAGGEATFGRLLLALAIITLSARVVGGAFRRWLKQPPVIGEILTGIVLGPSVLGALAPAVRAELFPAEIVPHIGVVAQIGVVLFMLLVGMELDTRELRRSSHMTLFVSHASIVVPFVLGALLALWMFPAWSPPGVSFTAFSLFLGVAMSITALPVLARILTDRGAQRTPLGSMALGCAAIDDVSAWSLLALVVGIMQSQVENAAMTLVWALAYILVMTTCARPLLRRALSYVHTPGEPASRSAMALVFGALLLSSLATERIGIHPLFGALLLGAILPREGDLREQVRARLEDVVVVLFLPAYFAFTGLRTEISALSGAQGWLACGAVIACATLGKLGGATLAARALGSSWRAATALGLLMNTRGLMQLIAANLGLELGVITPGMFTLLVIMALVTTAMASPLLDLVLGREGFALPIMPQKEAATRKADVLVSSDSR